MLLPPHVLLCLRPHAQCVPLSVSLSLSLSLCLSLKSAATGKSVRNTEERRGRQRKANQQEQEKAREEGEEEKGGQRQKEAPRASWQKTRKPRTTTKIGFETVISHPLVRTWKRGNFGEGGDKIWFLEPRQNTVRFSWFWPFLRKPKTRIWGPRKAVTENVLFCFLPGGKLSRGLFRANPSLREKMR